MTCTKNLWLVPFDICIAFDNGHNMLIRVFSMSRVIPHHTGYAQMVTYLERRQTRSNKPQNSSLNGKCISPCLSTFKTDIVCRLSTDWKLHKQCRLLGKEILWGFLQILYMESENYRKFSIQCFYGVKC